MKLFITFTKRNLIAITAAFVLFAAIAGEAFAPVDTGLDGSTNALRVEYCQSLGYKVYEESIQNKQISIPEEFGSVYNTYNHIQNQAGFDLQKYAGKAAVLYTYKLEECDEYGGETVFNIIVCDGKIIGGDISSTSFNGFMKPLLKINTASEEN